MLSLDIDQFAFDYLSQKGTQRMLLQRVYAYSIVPQKSVDKTETNPPAGGGVKITSALRDLVIVAFAKVHAKGLTSVDFENDADRQHTVREELMTIAFGATQAPKTAAARIAARLSAAMDNRSGDALLLITVEGDGPKQRVSMLLLPREEVVQLNSKPADEILLNLLKDAFSTGAELRKFAMVEGHNSRTQFLSADILDLQLTARNKDGADFWVKEFLAARLRMNSDSGTRQLVSALRRAFDAAPEDNRDAAFAAMLKAGSGLVKKTSLVKYAEELPEGLHEPYFRGVADEVQRTVFDVNPEVMNESIGRRIFENRDGVIISAPAEAVGRAVKIDSGGQQRTVSYVGVIKKERIVRSRKSPQRKTNEAPQRY